MKRSLCLAAGWFALILGFVGVVVPLLPTVAFWILAAWCFTRSSPRLETWLLQHPTAGPHIRAWRERGSISRKGKLAASAALVGSAALGFILLQPPWTALPAAACSMVALFIWTRPE